MAIYHPAGKVGIGQNVFGVSVANSQLYQALVLHGGLDQVDVLTHGGIPVEAIRNSLIGPAPCATMMGTASILDQKAAAAAGVVLRGGPKLDELAWLRRQTVGDDGYSLIGVIHTIAPPAMRQEIANASIAPVQAWDALVCTSPSVQTAMFEMFDEWTAYLADRFGGSVRPRPQLPLVPLGVDGRRFKIMADNRAAGDGLRLELGLEPGDILVLWVGRLSFFEKAFPQPMMRAVAEAAATSGVRVHFAMAGWFPGGAEEEGKYRQAAQTYSPDVGFHVLDGNDRERVGSAWAAADIFVSLVDNIQETFGITPIEAMAAGIPVVVSDWDGYRYTVQDGEQGFLIPTLGGPPGFAPFELVAGHSVGTKSYQQYVGVLAQHTAVNVGRAAEALTALIGSPDLRRRMGDAGRRRIRDTFDWKVVAPQYVALGQELNAIRARDARPGGSGAGHPVRGDPFRDFRGFATTVLTPDTRLRLRAGSGVDDVRRSASVALDQFGSNWRGNQDEAERIVETLADGRPRSVREILEGFAMNRRRRIQLSLLWLAKIGVIDWL